MLRTNGLAKKYITERYNILLQIPRIFRLFTINDHISDNSIQINIKFTFTVYEYILLSSFLHIQYIYKYIYIYIYNIYIYIYIYKLRAFSFL